MPGDGFTVAPSDLVSAAGARVADALAARAMSQGVRRAPDDVAIKLRELSEMPGGP